MCPIFGNIEPFQFCSYHEKKNKLYIIVLDRRCSVSWLTHPISPNALLFFVLYQIHSNNMFYRFLLTIHMQLYLGLFIYETTCVLNIYLYIYYCLLRGKWVGMWVRYSERFIFRYVNQKCIKILDSLFYKFFKMVECGKISDN